jgi:hypothetical protein
VVVWDPDNERESALLTRRPRASGGKRIQMKRKDKVKVTRPWKDDPDMGDMEDPEYREEIFSSLQYDGVFPEHLPDLKLREQYSEWLKKQ